MLSEEGYSRGLSVAAYTVERGKGWVAEEMKAKNWKDEVEEQRKNNRLVGQTRRIEEGDRSWGWFFSPSLCSDQLNKTGLCPPLTCHWKLWSEYQLLRVDSQSLAKPAASSACPRIQRVSWPHLRGEKRRILQLTKLFISEMMRSWWSEEGKGIICWATSCMHQ